MTVRPNPARRKLKSGDTIFTSAVRFPEPGLCEILGYAGFDVVVLDGEHGAVDNSAIDRLVQGCFAGGTVPVARVLRNHDPEAVMHALDLGAQGILMPHCRTADDARRLQQAAWYPPRGKRGLGPGRGALWGQVASREYLDTIEESILLIGLIEDVAGVENIEEIAATGLDLLWVGTGDLSMDLGVGQTDHPEVLECAERVLAACQRHNIACGFPVRDSATAQQALQQGYRAIGFGSAEQYVMQTSQAFLGAVRSRSPRA